LAPLPCKKLHPQGANRTRNPSARNNDCGLEAAPHQPFWACRCFRNELRRVIRAFAIRTASDLGDCFFGSGVLVSAAVAGLMRNCVAAVEPCATGCTLIGPADVGLRFGIMDNARTPGWFDEPRRGRPRPADLKHIQGALTHSKATTTPRYMRKGRTKDIATVAAFRQPDRTRKSPGTR
jgi:hypothetical protein